MAKMITKAKVKEDVVEIRYTENELKIEKEVIYKCKEKQHPDFDLAMSALVRDVYEILELPMDWAPQCMRITGVSFSLSEETGVEGAVITGVVELKTSNAPFCFNTPHIPFDQYSDGGTAPVMPEKTVRNLALVKEEALKYVEGKRAQEELAGV